MAARQTLRMKAKRDLEQHMKQHMKQHGCFHCRKKGNLQFSHLLRAKKDGDPRKMVCYVVKASRRAKVIALRKEMKKCGILCRRCHDAYDAHQRWGHPKVAWDAIYKLHGVAAAQWPKWESEYLSKSADWDRKIKEKLSG